MASLLAGEIQRAGVSGMGGMASEEIAAYRDRLQNVLIAARVGRADLAVSLARVRAAASFTNSLVECQEPVVSTKS